MKLEEEKKLVAKFMKYQIIDRLHTKNEHGNYIADGRPWNPESNREWWDEIWEKMDDEIWEIYSHYVSELHGESIIGNFDRYYHTAKPEICWKALIRTLEN